MSRDYPYRIGYRWGREIFKQWRDQCKDKGLPSGKDHRVIADQIFRYPDQYKEWTEQQQTDYREGFEDAVMEYLEFLDIS